LRNAAKQLNTRPKDLNEWLDTNGWCYKDGRRNRLPYARRIDSGLMKTISGEENGHSFVQPMITAKGLAKLSVLFSGGANADKV